MARLIADTLREPRHNLIARISPPSCNMRRDVARAPAWHPLRSATGQMVSTVHQKAWASIRRDFIPVCGVHRQICRRSRQLAYKTLVSLLADARAFAR